MSEETPVFVVQPDQGESYWQPVPANGYAEVRISHRKDPAIESFAAGIQVIAPNSYIREHVHPAQGDEGLDDFFARIGRERKPGEPAPEPFDRPADVERIEADTVFSRIED